MRLFVRKCTKHIGIWPLKRSLILHLQMFSLFSLIAVVGLSTSLFFPSPPLRRGISILLIALSVSFLVASYLSSWFGLLIFLIYVGGLLVIFAYFSSINPNQQLEFLKILSFILLGLLYCRATFSFFLPTSISISPTSPFILFLISWPNTFILLGLGGVLFLALIIVVKITSLSDGPLRPFL